MHRPWICTQQCGSPVPWSDLPLQPTWPEGRHVVWAVLSPHTSYTALQGFNVNLLTTDRVSALHEACLGGHVACAKVLLENGAQVSPGDAGRDAGTWSKDTPSISRDIGWTARVARPECRWTEVSWAETAKHKTVLFLWVLDLPFPSVCLSHPITLFCFPSVPKV